MTGFLGSTLGRASVSLGITTLSLALAAPARATDEIQVYNAGIAAAGQFTHGLRAFFLAIAILAWFITWWAFVIATLVIMAALANRQFNSRARNVAHSALGRFTAPASANDRS